MIVVGVQQALVLELTLGLVGPVVDDQIAERSDALTDLEDARLVELATRHFDGAALDTRDGVKASYGEGWIHVRASNTEAILRLIGESEDGAWLKRRLDDAEVFFSGVLAGGD